MNPRQRILLSVSTLLSCRFFPAVGALVSTTTDVDIVTRQLGYRPTNFVKVSARNRDGIPIAIQTYPLAGGAQRRQNKARKSIKLLQDDNDINATTATAWLGTPFPTLYWLTCPDISKCVANLERQGYVKKIEYELRQDDQMAQALLLAHKDYARQRWDSLAEQDRWQLSLTSAQVSSSSSTVQRMRDMLESSGIAGSNLTLAVPPPIKCLHTHYAHFRSTKSGQQLKNPVGARVHEILLDEYPSLIL